MARQLLEEAGFAVATWPDLHDFVSGLSEKIGLAVVTEEALRTVDLKPLSAWIEAQPSWSDLPFIVLTQRGGGPERNPAAARLSEILGNVTFLERPFHPTSFISMARSALRGRRRQYEACLRMEALDEGERRLKTALEAGRLGAWELDLAGTNLTTSPACKAVFGRPADVDFTYDQLIASIHEDDRHRMRSAVEATIKSGVDYRIEYRTIWPDGSHHWAEIRAQLYRGRDGAAMRLVGVSADITQRKREEESRRRQNEILEERVAERTAELESAHKVIIEEAHQRERAEEQLRQSQKLEAIGQLTGGVAHDFNNLLMAVLGNLELLRKHVGDDPKALRLIDGAQQGARRGASLTQRLLAFARRQDLQVKPIDLSKLVTGMEDLLRRSVGPSVVIRSQIPDRLPPVMADPNQIELALLNLAVNARDAMPEGGSLDIRLRQAEAAGGGRDLDSGLYLVLSVIDTGVGMDAETLARAVEPFFSTKELGKGTGLGLSMIHGLALQLGGTLKLTSAPGSGTTAELWIPVAADEAVVDIPVEGIIMDAQNVTGPKRILLVDDDVLIAMSSADMVTDLGHEVVEAHSGAEALKILKDGGEFDLIITDYSMPGMTGAELAVAARVLRPDMPILLATGYAELPPGADINVARLGKPYSQEQLATEISKALNM